jgi:amino acid adenylation domain-containing protein
MKLLLTMNLPYTRAHGGTNRSNRSLAEALAARGHTVRVVVPALATPSRITRAELLDQLRQEELTVIEADGVDQIMIDGVDVRAVVEASRLRGFLIEQLREFSPDWVLVSAEDPSQTLLAAALQVCPDRVIYLAHTPQMFPFGPASLYPGAERTRLVTQCAAVVTISRFVADYIKQWSGIEAFHNHPPHFGGGPFPQLGRFDSGHVLLMNASAVKGLPILLGLARAFPDVSFAVLGGYGTTSDDHVALRALPNVTALPNRRDLDDIFCQTRALLMPSLWMEGFGMAAVDAMLRGIPVLASNYGGLTEATLGAGYLLPVRPIEQFEDRLDDNMLPVPIVPAQDIAPWSAALADLLSSRARYEQQANAAYRAANEFVAGLSVVPFELMLTRLAANPQQRRAQRSVVAAPPAAPAAPRSGVNEKLAQLTPEQRALLVLRLKQKSNGTPAPEPAAATAIEPGPPDRAPALSFAQERFWFLEQLNPGTAAYTMPIAVRLTGALDRSALERSLSALRQRHAVLRASFPSADGLPSQVIDPEPALAIPLLDLTPLSPEQRAAAVERLALEEAQQPFDLARGPLLRVRLLHLAPTEHVLLITLHHIIADGWSIGVLIRELGALYAAAVQPAQLAALAPLPIQYADYAHWQRQYVQGAVLESQLAYWKKQLGPEGAPAPAGLNLPTDRPRPAQRTTNGAIHAFALPPALAQALARLSQQEGATLFMTLLAAFKTLLQRYSGQDDIIVGTPVAGRTRAETEGLIGLFLNTLALRTDLSGQPTFRQLLGRVRDTALGAYSHQDLSFEQIVEAVQPPRELSRTPLFQVQFVLQNTPATTLALPGLTLESIEVDRGVAKFELTLEMTEAEGGLSGAFNYNTDLFDAATIARLAGHFTTLLHAIAADPHERIDRLPLLTAAERQLLQERAGEFSRAGSSDCLHDRVAAQARRTPDAIALVCEDERISYRELERRANQLAQRLRRDGVGPDVIVGLCLERSLEVVVGLLGILKAGGAYLPIEPSLPPERIQFMLDDVAAPVVITQQRLIARLPATGRAILALDRDWPSIAQEPAAPPASGVTAENLAYIIFTSGSTGLSKGVAVEHRQLLNYVDSIVERLDLPPAASFATVSTFAADLGHTMLFPALCLGGALHIIVQERLYNPDAFAAYMAESAIDCLKIVPSHLQALLTAANPAQTLPRRRLILGGESSSADWIKELQALAPACRIFNHYGPTETTVGVLTAALDESVAPAALAPLGRPIANVQAYVLDAQMQLAPIGVPGELYIGGASVTRGYWQRPALTAERFVPNPFVKDEGTPAGPRMKAESGLFRLYKTGDLVRWRPDGQLEFLGRIDQQVKIRGFRVELGEIASVLAQHPAVQDVAVLAREDAPGDPRLVAYVVREPRTNRAQGNKRTSEQGGAETTDHRSPITDHPHDLRAFLAQRLPEYMIPAAFVELPALPLTPNGKLDRKALPAPGAEQPEQRPVIAPRDADELRLLQIWESLLETRPISVTDDFFALGGHSLLAVRLIAQIQQQFGQALPLATLFKGASIEQLAVQLRQPHGAAWSPLVELHPGPNSAQAPLFFVHPLGGNVFGYLDLARGCGLERPFFGLQAAGLYGDQQPLRRIEAMASYYLAAVRAEQPHGPYFLGGWSMGGVIAFEMAQQLIRQGEQVALLALLDSTPPASSPAEPISDALVARQLAVEFGLRLDDLPASASLDELTPRLLTLAKQAGAIPPDTDPAALRRFVELYQAHLEALNSYAPRRYPGQITLFQAAERADADDLAQAWAALALDGVERQIADGNHLTMIQPPHVEQLAQQLRTCWNVAPVLS